MKMTETLKELEKELGYQFRDINLLKQAVTHSSYSNEKNMGKLGCNERLEFLGDAVLEVISSEFLYQKFPILQEGELTKKRASMVCEPTLALCAREIRLDNYLLLGHGEENTGGRKRDSIVSDALEAVIGAIYLDGGLASAKEFILKHVLNDMEHKQLFYDSKTILQGIVQEHGNNPVSYQLIREDGPDHNKIFTVEVRVKQEVLGVGQGHTKKAAEQAAAYQAVMALRKTKVKYVSKKH